MKDKFWKSIANSLIPGLVYRGYSQFERKKIKEKVLTDAYYRTMVAAALMVLVQLVFVITFNFNGYYSSSPKDVLYLTVGVEVFLIVSSLIYIAVARFFGKKTNSTFKFVSLYIYLLEIVLGMIIFVYIDVLKMPESNSLSYLYIIAIVFCSIPNVIANSSLFVLSLFGLIGIGWHIPNSMLATNIEEYILILVIFFLLFLYTRASMDLLFVLNFKNTEMNKELRIKSFTDHLTGCQNRYSMNEFFIDNREKWALNKNHIGILFFDIDNFKIYNDTNYHEKGDECLKHISQAIITLCNRKMKNVFRYGGEEFVVIVEDVDEYTLIQAGLEIKKVVEDLKIERKDSTLQPYVTISVGAALAKINFDTDLSSILEIADGQLYKAKGRGKNCLFYKNHKYI